MLYLAGPSHRLVISNKFLRGSSDRIERTMKLEEWYTPRQIAKARNVSYDTARRWIMEILGDDIALGVKKNKGRGKRPWHLRRLPESRLGELDQFMNR